MVEEKDEMWLEKEDWSWGSSAATDAPWGPEMGVRDMRATGQRQLNGSQDSPWPLSLGDCKGKRAAEDRQGGGSDRFHFGVHLWPTPPHTFFRTDKCMTPLWEIEGCVVSLKTRL